MGVWGKDRYRVVRGGEDGAERSDRYTGGKKVHRRSSGVAGGRSAAQIYI